MNIVLAPFLNKRTVENYGTPFCNHFLLRIPYASKQLEWEIIFNEEDYTFAPDFYFRDEHFLSDPDYDVIMNNVPSLVQWNLKNPKSLITVLRELVTFYKKIQVSNPKTCFGLYLILLYLRLRDCRMRICLENCVRNIVFLETHTFQKTVLKWILITTKQ